MVQDLISSIKEPGNPTTYTNTPKFVEKVVVEVMKIDKAVEFDGQTMAIMSLNMGNLTLEVNILKNKFVTWEKEKAM
jgi:chromosome segregation and condensation protein ScpB